MPLRLYPRSRHRSARQSRRRAWWRNAFRIVGASRQRVGDVDGGAVEQAGQLGVEPGGAVLAAPQLVVLGIRPARRDGAVDQAHSTLDQADGLGHSQQGTSPPRPARSARLATKLNTVSGEISRRELLRTVLPKIRAISVARYNPHDFGRPLPCSTARSTHCALVAPAPASATTSAPLVR